MHPTGLLPRNQGVCCRLVAHDQPRHVPCAGAPGFRPADPLLRRTLGLTSSSIIPINCLSQTKRCIHNTHAGPCTPSHPRVQAVLQLGPLPAHREPALRAPPRTPGRAGDCERETGHGGGVVVRRERAARASPSALLRLARGGLAPPRCAATLRRLSHGHG